MPFQPGNEESKKADHKRPRVITQQLIAELNEVDRENVPKLRAIVRSLVHRAMEGDVAAFKEIADRVEGKVPQALTGEDGGALTVLIKNYTG